ncbi:hypothetical protein EIK77_003751 [Talaromyces pinophilus]|nr:hypothetical protein EIK77_003751 [Talaromyces pinophilus]
MFMLCQIGYSAAVPPMSSSDSSNNPDSTRSLETQPFFLDYEGPPVIGLERPKFPENLDQLKPTERQKAHTSTLIWPFPQVHETNITLYRAMEYRETTSYTMLLLAQIIFVDGEALYRSYVVELQKEWESLPEIQARGNPPYPFQFSSDELDAINQDAADAIRGMNQMNDLKTELGDLWPEKGLVRHDQYEDVKISLASAKERFLDEYQSLWSFMTWIVKRYAPNPLSISKGSAMSNTLGYHSAAIPSIKYQPQRRRSHATIVP